MVEPTKNGESSDGGSTIELKQRMKTVLFPGQKEDAREFRLEFMYSVDSLTNKTTYFLL